MSQHLLFPDQRSDEKLILIVRRHWSRMFKHVLKFASAFIIPIIIGLVVFLYFQIALESEIIFMIIVMVVSLYYLFIILFFLNDFIDYYLDIWVVTDQRVVNVEQEGLFNRTISSLTIEKVQDVTSEIKGKLQTFMDFGQVYIQTAGEKERFLFEEVPHPAKIAKLVQDIHDRHIEEEEKEHNQELAEAIGQPKGEIDFHQEPPTLPKDENSIF